MKCPVCNKEVPLGTVTCPRCGADVDEPGAGHIKSLIYCEGCGARLVPADRVCPKCGRPAPGVLSADSASADLAAGNTASFPRLSKSQIDTGVPDLPASSAARLVSDTISPEETSVIDLSGSEPTSGSTRAASGKDAPDPYHPKRRRPSRKVVGAVAAVAAVAAACVLVALDPLGVMPSLYESVVQAASEMYPSREDGEESTADDGEDAASTAQESSESVSVTDAVLSDSETYARLCDAYADIVAYKEELSDVVADYNAWYIANDYDSRVAGSESAYALRDEVEASIDELEELNIADGSVYEEDLENLLQLLEWLLGYVDVLCQSWDISLALGEDATPSDYRSDIVAPLVDSLGSSGTNEDLSQFNEYLEEWEPEEKAS